jgi:hypothetical protein
MPASQIALAAFGFAILLAFGVMLAWLYHRWNARQANSAE